MTKHAKHWADIKGASWQYYHHELKGKLRREDKILLLLVLAVFILHGFVNTPPY